jgi:hypothetical protein
MERSQDLLLFYSGLLQRFPSTRPWIKSRQVHVLEINMILHTARTIANRTRRILENEDYSPSVSERRRVQDPTHSSICLCFLDDIYICSDWPLPFFKSCFSFKSASTYLNEIPQRQTRSHAIQIPNHGVHGIPLGSVL